MLRTIPLVTMCLLLGANGAFAKSADLPGATVKFTDITEASGTGDHGRGKGVAFADIDNDGDLDIYVSNKGGINKMYRNDGNGKFTDITVASGTEDEGFCMGSVFGDIDNDGDMDLYLAKGGRYEIEANRLLLNDGHGVFTDVTAAAGVGTREFTYSATMSDVDRDGFLDIYCANYGVGAQNVLFLNQGDGTFIDVSDIAGVGDRSWSWDASFCDVDGDGDDDLYVINGRYPDGEPNKLYINESTKGNPKFVERTKDAGLMERNWGLGATFADFDQDGDFDLFVSNYVGANAFYINDGKGQFTLQATAFGLADKGWGKGPTIGDVNHDGLIDLYEGDCKVGNQLYVNTGTGKFVNVLADNADLVAMRCETVRTKGTAFADIDNDGDLDLYVVNWAVSNRLFRNDLNNKGWLKVNSVGMISNKDSIGAKVSVFKAGHLGDMDYFVGIRNIRSGTGFCAQEPKVQHFGVDPAGLYDVKVEFPSGQVGVAKGVKPTQTITIVEPVETAAK